MRKQPTFEIRPKEIETLERHMFRLRAIHMMSSRRMLSADEQQLLWDALTTTERTLDRVKDRASFTEGGGE